MEIKESIYKTKCDIGGCKNLSHYYIVRQQKNILNICKDCAKELDDLLRSISVPKSIPAPYKKQRRV